MNILILGSGGREHALTWKLAQSDKTDSLYVAPGNAGTASIATNVPLNLNDFESIKSFVQDSNIEMIVVGPEEPLVKGIRDFFHTAGLLDSIKFIGPDSLGAQLEGSKDFSKAFMKKHGIPTAGSLTVTEGNIEQGLAFLSGLNAPYVLKADGLAAGKGVIISSDLDEAKTALHKMLEGQFGEASSKVLIEEYLHGIELSVFVLTDGGNYKILPEAKDYKRIGEGDTGPNTGGMGAVSPVPFADNNFMAKVEQKVIVPTVTGLKNDGIDYVGFIFIGLMNVNGEPFVIEYNVRMGDPETQVVIPRIKSDLVELFEATANRTLNNQIMDVSEETATTVVAVAGGYPGQYAKGHRISGLNTDTESVIFHAGTKPDDKNILTNGGRVIASTGLSHSIESALKLSYGALERITWDGMNYRKDIGKDLLV